MSYDPDVQRQFEDWKARAAEADILSVANLHGAKLRRTGSEWVGPCPVCGGKDRFSVNTTKRIWNCRGFKGGDVIGMTMHIAGVDFLAACEMLTGEPPPRGKSREITAEEREARDRRRRESEEKAKQQQREAEMSEAEMQAAAARIWKEAVPPGGTIGEQYLVGRGIPIPAPGWPDVLRFHRSLRHPSGVMLPALVARVDDASGDLCAVWRIYIDPVTAKKANVDNAKLGLGPAGGGAVRIGGIGPKVGVAEGVETALGAWSLIGQRYPVWAALSTSGMKGLELPLDVQSVTVFPDGDVPLRQKDGAFIPVSVPPGREAAQVLRERVISVGAACTIAAEPPPGLDYLDLWNAQTLEPV